MFLFLHLDFIFWSVLVTFLHQSEAGTLRESVMVFSPNSPMSAFWAPTHPSLLLANIDFASQLIFYKYKVSCVENTHLTFYVHFHFPYPIPFFRFTFWSHYLFPPPSPSLSTMHNSCLIIHRSWSACQYWSCIISLLIFNFQYSKIDIHSRNLKKRFATLYICAFVHFSICVFGNLWIEFHSWNWRFPKVSSFFTLKLCVRCENFSFQQLSRV